MQSDRVCAVLCVRDISSVRTFYEALFGRPPDANPMDSLMEWYPNEGGGVQIFQEDERAGRGYATISVPNLDDLVIELQERSIPIDPYGMTFDPFRLARVVDPDGNQITFAQAVIH